MGSSQSNNSSIKRLFHSQPATFASDLQSASRDSRKVYSSEPKPKHPLPKCFFDLKPDADGKGFHFDFQWGRDDGAHIYMRIVDEASYPTGHSWKAQADEVRYMGPIMARQEEWAGMPLRETLEVIGNLYWDQARSSTGNYT